MAQDMDGKVIKVDDHVGFKDGTEKYGKVTRVTGEMVQLDVWNSQEGRYEQRSIASSRIWHE